MSAIVIAGGIIGLKILDGFLKGRKKRKKNG